MRRSQEGLFARIALGNKIILGLILAPNMLIFKIIISTQNRVNGQPDFNAKAGLVDFMTMDLNSSCQNICICRYFGF